MDNSKEGKKEWEENRRRKAAVNVDSTTNVIPLEICNPITEISLEG